MFTKTNRARATSRAAAAPAASGGLNDLDPLPLMDPQYAISLLNFFPDTGLLRTRAGYKEWATSFVAPVDTLMVYRSTDGTNQLFAATAAGIYNVSSPTQAPTLVKAATNGKWSWTNYANVSGQYLVAVNGVDPGVIYDGTSWISMTQTDTPVNVGDIKGISPTQLSHVLPHKGRIWFLQVDSRTSWYWPTDAVAGEVKPFYLGGVLKRGGLLLAMATWSLDSGDGLDDKLVFFSSVGEVAGYAGTDPASVNSWGLEALYFTSTPLGARGIADFGGDTVLLSRQGILPLSKVVQGSATSALYSETLSRRVNRSINRLAVKTDFVRSWEIFTAPVFEALIVNVPQGSNTSALQFVMNLQTGAWTTYDLPASTFAFYNNVLFFGTEDGRVMQHSSDIGLDNTLFDNTGGVPVNSYLMTAYSYFGDPTSIKHFKFVRPIFVADHPPKYKLRAAVDYELLRFAGNPSPPGASSQNALWDFALWDQAFWAGAGETYRPWVGVDAMGYAGALQLKVSSNAPVQLVALEWVLSSGGMI